MSGHAHLPDWRNRAAYDGIAALGRDALAWEVLRRDPAYQRLALTVAPAVGVPADGFGAASDWGLHFP